MIRKCLGKKHQKCGMCHEYGTYSYFFHWKSMITSHELEVCLKCARRECGSGKKAKAKIEELIDEQNRNL